MESLILLLRFCFYGLLSPEGRSIPEAFTSVAKHHLINTQLRWNQPHWKLAFTFKDENSWKCLHCLRRKWWQWQLCGWSPPKPTRAWWSWAPRAWVRLCIDLVISLHRSSFWSEDRSRTFKISGLFFFVTSSKEQEQVGSTSPGKEMASLSAGFWSSRYIDTRGDHERWQQHLWLQRGSCSWDLEVGTRRFSCWFFLYIRQSSSCLWISGFLHQFLCVTST